MKYAHS